MNPFTRRGSAAAFLVPALLVALPRSARAQNPMPGMKHDMAGMDMGLPPVTIPKGAIFTEADVRFMQGMIAHHGQAIYMARMAAQHNAEPHLLKFAMKIDQSQRAEIALMQG